MNDQRGNAGPGHLPTSCTECRRRKQKASSAAKKNRDSQTAKLIAISVVGIGHASIAIQGGCPTYADSAPRRQLQALIRWPIPPGTHNICAYTSRFPTNLASEDQKVA
jgi:hypothetical protein